MGQKDRLIASFWVLVGLAICYRSLSLTVGTLSRPGPGFMPFIAGAMIGLLGLVLLFGTLLPKKGLEGEKAIQVRFNFYRLVLVVFILVAYSVLLNWLGYLISTFLLMFFLLSLGGKKRKWWFTVGVALLTTSISYFVFRVWLQCPFPKGVLRGILKI